METICEWLNESLEKADHRVFKDVISIDADIESLGDGQVVLISDIKRLHLSLTTSNGEKRLLKAIAKSEAQDGPGKQLAFDTGAFSTETKMYSSVLKSMENVMLEVGDNTFIWPECYYCGDNKFLFQDLCEIGCSIVPAYKLLNLEHALLVMIGIGKFHGLSMVLRERGNLDIDEVKPFFARINPAMESIHKKSVETFVQTVKEHWEEEWSSVADRFAKYFDNMSEKLRDVWSSTKDKWGVVNHGDFSIRNMLFHYKQGSPDPDAVKFVDFQMCHYSNLGFDLTNILYSSMLPTVRDENLDDLLEVYTDSLVSTCKRHGYKRPLPSVIDVRECLKELNLMSTCMSFFLLPFMIQSDQKDVQKKADDYIDCYKESSDSKPIGLINFADPIVANVLKYELNRCMKENLF